MSMNVIGIVDVSVEVFGIMTADMFVDAFASSVFGFLHSTFLLSSFDAFRPNFFPAFADVTFAFFGPLFVHFPYFFVIVSGVDLFVGYFVVVSVFIASTGVSYASCVSRGRALGVRSSMGLAFCMSRTISVGSSVRTSMGSSM